MLPRRWRKPPPWVNPKSKDLRYSAKKKAVLEPPFFMNYFRDTRSIAQPREPGFASRQGCRVVGFDARRELITKYRDWIYNGLI